MLQAAWACPHCSPPHTQTPAALEELQPQTGQAAAAASLPSVQMSQSFSKTPRRGGREQHVQASRSWRVIFFFLPFFSNGWASARRRCQRLDATNSPQDTLSQRHRRCWGSNKRDRLQIESCCLPGLLKDRRGRQRRIIAPFTSSAILAVLSKSRWTNKVMKES